MSAMSFDNCFTLARMFMAFTALYYIKSVSFTAKKWRSK